MPNPSGTNGGAFIPEPAYGDVKRQQGLLRAAPISGAPVSTAAIETPRRSGQQAKRAPSQQQPPAADPQQLPVETPPPPYGAQVAKAWAEIAASPGAAQFPILAQLAQAAEQEANHA